MATQSTPEIVAYLKPVCGWSAGVRAVLDKYALGYEDKDIINSPMNYQEMVIKSGQPLSPCVVVDGRMLADVSGEEVEAWLADKGYIAKNNLAHAGAHRPRLRRRGPRRQRHVRGPVAPPFAV